MLARFRRTVCDRLRHQVAADSQDRKCRLQTSNHGRHAHRAGVEDSAERHHLLGKLLHTPVRKLSLGQRMRCDLAASLLHAPGLLFLDEPTIGLDLVAKDGVRSFLKEINQTFDTTAIVTTHDLRDIEELCSRILIIDHGRLLYDGGLSGLKYVTGNVARLRVEIRGEGGEKALTSATEGLAVSWRRLGPGFFEGEFLKDRHAVADVVRRIVTGTPVHDLAVLEPPIEEVVQKIYKGEVDLGAPSGVGPNG